MSTPIGNIVFALTVKRVRGGAVELGKLLAKRGIASAPRYIQKPAFMCEVFQKQRTFGNTNYPFGLARPEATQL